MNEDTIKGRQNLSESQTGRVVQEIDQPPVPAENTDEINICPSTDWPVEAAHYNILGKIGKGAFASVYKAKTKCTDQKLCGIKIINLEHVDTNFVDIRLEVQTMRLSQNENILSCYTSFIHHTNLWLVMQLMDKGSSLYCLQKARILYHPLNQVNQAISAPVEGEESKQLPKATDLELHITYILYQTILGLQYIHSHGQIHRDIKASNLLLDSSASLRIADFGVSGWLITNGSQRENTRTFVGTPCWMAPEVMEQIHGYDTKADIWSLGITALELAKGFAPYAKYPPMKVLLMTIQEDPPGFESYRDYDQNFDYEGDDDSNSDTILKGRCAGKLGIGVPNTWSKSFQAVISWCLQKDPSKRPNCEELLKHEHFKIFAGVDGQQKREVYQQKLKEEICDWIPNVGVEETPNTNNTTAATNNQDVAEAALPLLETNNSDIPVCVVSAMEENRPSGTTWVFNDGSQVVATTSSGDGVTAETGDFFDDFELNTQGEDFKHPSTSNEIQVEGTNKKESPPEKATEEDDDLMAFMDQFESETGGENFRK